MSNEDTSSDPIKTAACPATWDLIEQLMQLESSKNRLHLEYMGKAMPADVYLRFQNLRDERIPALRSQLRLGLASAPDQPPAHFAYAYADQLMLRCMVPVEPGPQAVEAQAATAAPDTNLLRAEILEHASKGSRLVRTLFNEPTGTLSDVEVGDWIQRAQQYLTLPSQAAPAAVAVPDERWCPDVCPITGREFFMWVTHHESGADVPTYGGPFDSYTIPTQDKDGSFSCERYDHDFGGWKDWESVGLMLVDDQSFVVAPDNPRYYEIEQFATPALPATEDFSAGDLAAVQAEPVIYVSRGQLETHTDPESDGGRYLPARRTPLGLLNYPLYSAPQAQPADALERDVRTALQMLQDREWAENFAKSDLGKQLESAITDLHSEIHEAHESDDAEVAAMAAAQEGGKA